jgi:hypothetical protein
MMYVGTGSPFVYRVYGAFYHPSSMRSSLKVILPVLAAFLAAPAAAFAEPAISVDRPCYASPPQRADVVRVTGSGFTPNAAFQVTLDGQPLVTTIGTTDAAGNLASTFPAPAPDGGRRERAFVLGVQEGANAATTRFSVAWLTAAFRPSTGDPARMRVAFQLVGFGLSGRVAPPVYVHYVRPDGKLLHTVRLGTGKGPCGSLEPALRRRLFPFKARGGVWRLQFDTAKGYRRGTPKSTFLFFTVTVKVQAG